MKTIVWDVDDVLNDCMRVWFDTVWRPANDSSPIEYKGIDRNPPHDRLGMSIADYRDSLDAFRHTPEYSAMQPVHESLSWFQEYGDRCHHVALTAVPMHAAHVSSAWVMKHFGAWIRTFAVIPTPRSSHPVPDYDSNKASYLSRLSKVACFIDDSPSHIEEASELGIQSVHFPRPWNKDRDRGLDAFFAQISQIL